MSVQNRQNTEVKTYPKLTMLLAILSVIFAAFLFSLASSPANSGECKAEFLCKKGSDPVSVIRGDGPNDYIATSDAEAKMMDSGFNQVRDCGKVKVTCSGKNTKFKRNIGNE